MKKFSEILHKGHTIPYVSDIRNIDVMVGSFAPINTAHRSVLESFFKTDRNCDKVVINVGTRNSNVFKQLPPSLREALIETTIGKIYILDVNRISDVPKVLMNERLYPVNMTCPEEIKSLIEVATNQVYSSKNLTELTYDTYNTSLIRHNQQMIEESVLTGSLSKFITYTGYNDKIDSLEMFKTLLRTTRGEE